MRQSSIAFKSKDVNLEGVIASPQELSGPFPGVVVCHPNPLFGGSMDNGVVLAVCRALVEEGFLTFRFNFRGVGDSEGTFTKGEKEQEDVRAALNLLRRWPGVDKRRLGLVGYSFGASMVLTALSRYKAAGAFVLISPPLAALDYAGIGRDKRPKLFIVGDRDRLVPYCSLKEKVLHTLGVESLHGSVDLQMVSGADHSWRGYEAEAAQQSTRFFVGTLQR